MNRDELIEILAPVAEFGQPGPRGAAYLDVGNAGYLQYFQSEVIDRLIAHNGSTCRFFEGPYGSGKTHILKLLRDLAFKNRFAVATIELSKAVHIDDWRLVAASVLECIELKIGTITVRTLPSILEALATDGAIEPDRLSKGSLPHSGFQNAIDLAARRSSLEPQARKLLHDYLLGKRIGVGQFRNVRIRGIRDPLSRRNAEQVLATVFGALHLLGLQGTLVQFDENEQMLRESRYPSRRTAIAANLIRRMIDACSNGDLQSVLVVFAVLPGFLSSCASVYPALGQRLYQDLNQDTFGWRWPVLSVEQTTDGLDPERFAQQAIRQMMALLRDVGIRGNDDGASYRTAAHDVLQRNAGLGYRRDLMKTLATIALEEL